MSPPPNNAPRASVRRPWSMTARLISLQVLATSVLFGCALVMLYYNISSHLDADNRDGFSREIGLISRWLADAEKDSPVALVTPDKRTAFLTTLPVFVRIIEPDGKLRFENSPEMAVPLPEFPDPGQVVLAWRAPSHQRFLLGAVTLRPTEGRRSSVLQVAYDVSDDDTLLRHLRQRMGLMFGLVIVLSGILALLIARGVFRPLSQLATVTAQVHATHLTARIDESGWPVELTTLAREFDAMLGRLESSFRRLARFSSDLSHELRTPINNLRGEAEVALNRPRTPDEYRAVLESSLEEYARITRLIDTLLFIAKADQPERGLECQQLDAAAECRTVVDFFEAASAERELTLLVRGQAMIYCDPTLFRRALGNLVDNAMRHTPSGGHIDLTVRAGTNGGTEVEVSDSGIGIAAEHLPHVFERFYQVARENADATAPVSGFGLGLAIVKSIMELHGGDVTIASTPSRGTTISLFFPGAAAASVI